MIQSPVRSSRSNVFQYATSCSVIHKTTKGEPRGCALFRAALSNGHESRWEILGTKAVQNNSVLPPRAPSRPCVNL